MTTITINVEVSEKLIRKMRAYAVMTDQTSKDFVDRFTKQYISSQLNTLVDRLIASELDMETEYGGGIAKNVATNADNWAKHLSSGLQEDSLYDGDIGKHAAEVESNFTDEDLEHDLDVTNPEEEAAAEADPSAFVPESEEELEDEAAVVPEKRTTVKKTKEALDMQKLARSMGINLESVDGRHVGRFNPKPQMGRGKVSNMAHNASTAETF